MRAFLLVFLLVFVAGTSSAQVANPPVPVQQPAPRPYTGKMSEATVGVVEMKMGKLGFAANDPRYQATKGAVWGGIGTAATYVGTALIIGGVAAISWPAVLVAAGVGAVVGGVLSLADGALTSWMFNEDGTVTQVAVGGPTNAVPGMCWVLAGTTGCFSTVTALASAFNSQCLAVNPDCPWTMRASGNTLEYCDRINGSGGATGCSQGVWSQWFSQASNVPGDWTDNGSGGEPVTTTARPMEILENLTPEQAAQPLSAEMLAAAANAMWKYAAEQNPNALPWSPSNPITVADVNEWRSANPALWPSVGDFASAMAPPNSQTVPTPGGNTVPGVTPTPGTGQQIDLGPDPNVGAPGLERIPTAEEILAPGWNLMPDLRNFVMPSQAGECPRPAFDVFEKTYSMQAHCDLFEQNRSILQLAMVALYSILAVVIVLRA